MRIENEVSLRDILSAFLKSWRIITAISIAIAVLAGVIGLIRSIPTGQEHDLTIDAQWQELENISLQIENHTEYMENSIWLNLDPSDVALTKYVIMVDSDTGTVGAPVSLPPDSLADHNTSIVLYYINKIKDEDCINKLCELLGTDNRSYAIELLTIEQLQDSNLFTFSARHSSIEMTEQMALSVWEYINEADERYHKDHTISLVSSISLRASDPYIESSKNNYKKMIGDLIAQKMLMETQSLAEDISQSGLGSLIFKAALFGVIGFVIGLFFSLFFVMCSRFLDTSLRSPTQISDTFGIPMLGSVKISRKGGIY